MQKRKVLSVILGLSICLGVGVGFWLGAGRVQSETGEIGQAESDTGLPQIEITLSGVDLEDMKAGTKDIWYNGNQFSLDGESIGEVGIRGRGNATWTRDKRPWQINFEDEVELLGITKARKWVLLANMIDASHLRNYMASSVATMLGMEYNFLGRMVEVSFDGIYEGLFYLMPKIELDEGSVDLRDRLGVLVEIDNFYQGNGYYLSYGGNYIFLKDAVAEKDETVRDQAMEEFMTDFNRLEIAAKRGDYATAAEVADLTSLAQYYLVNEFALDPDAYFIGMYFYKDGSQDKIHAGPVWDFDFAFANYMVEEWERIGYNSPYELLMRREGVINNELIYDLMAMPEFREEVERVFQEWMSGRGEEFVQKMEQQAELIQQAVELDAGKWGYVNYKAETERVLEWVEERYQYFEEVFGEKSGAEDGDEEDIGSAEEEVGSIGGTVESAGDVRDIERDTGNTGEAEEDTGDAREDAEENGENVMKNMIKQRFL